MKNNLNWSVDYTRQDEGIYELKIEGSYYRYYVTKNNKEEIKKSIAQLFMLSEESRNKAIEILDNLQF